MLLGRALQLDPKGARVVIHKQPPYSCARVVLNTAAFVIRTLSSSRNGIIQAECICKSVQGYLDYTKTHPPLGQS